MLIRQDCESVRTFDPVTGPAPSMHSPNGLLPAVPMERVKQSTFPDVRDFV